MSLKNLSWMSFLVFAPAMAFGAGCGGESDAAPPAGDLYKYPKEADFCEALAKAECNAALVDACYGDSEATSVETCVTLRSKTSVCRTIPNYEDADMSGVAYNPEVAEGCVINRASIYADAKLTREELEANGEACLGVFSKGVGDGDTCSSDIDCVTTKGLRCVMKAGAAEGTCATPNPIGGGQKCESANSTCVDGFFCNGKNCVARIELGAACSESELCEEGLSCADDGNGATMCTAKAASNAGCTLNEECQGTFCVKPSGASEGLCSSSLRFEQTSASCDPFRN